MKMTLSTQIQRSKQKYESAPMTGPGPESLGTEFKKINWYRYHHVSGSWNPKPKGKKIFNCTVINPDLELESTCFKKLEAYRYGFG